MLNNIILIGNLTASPELKTTPNGKNCTSFCIAVNEYYKDKQTTQFIDCVAWNKTAEFITKYFVKGKKIFVSGKLTTRTYEYQGQNRKVSEVMVETVQFVDSNNKFAKNEDTTIGTDIMSEDDLPF